MVPCSLPFLDSHAPSVFILQSLMRLAVPLNFTNVVELVRRVVITPVRTIKLYNTDCRLITESTYSKSANKLRFSSRRLCLATPLDTVCQIRLTGLNYIASTSDHYTLFE